MKQILTYFIESLAGFTSEFQMHFLREHILQWKILIFQVWVIVRHFL